MIDQEDDTVPNPNKKYCISCGSQMDRIAMICPRCSFNQSDSIVSPRGKPKSLGFLEKFKGNNLNWGEIGHQCHLVEQEIIGFAKAYKEGYSNDDIMRLKLSNKRKDFLERTSNMTSEMETNAGSKIRQYSAPEISVDELSKDLYMRLKNQGFKSQVFEGDGSSIVKAQRSGWNSVNLTVKIDKDVDILVIEIFEHKGSSKETFQMIDTYIKNKMEWNGNRTNDIIVDSLSNEDCEKVSFIDNVNLILSRRGISPDEVLIAEEGTNGQIILTNTGVIIGREKSDAFMNFWGKGDKFIIYKSIMAVQFKEPGRMAGYIQFSILGGIENRGGVIEAVSDENTVTFNIEQLKAFKKIRNIVENKINITEKPNTSYQLSIADELYKLANLKRDGLITEDEYNKIKSQLLDK